MVNGTRLVRADSVNLGFECRYTRIEFGDRKRVEVLPGNQGYRISGTGRRGDIIRIHATEGCAATRRSQRSRAKENP